jgi:hypothetical protein
MSLELQGAPRGGDATEANAGNRRRYGVSPNGGRKEAMK